MKQVEIYSRPGCSYCQQAKELLKARGIAYQEQDISQDEALIVEMVRRTGGRTLPQILISDRPIGGFSELRQLDSSQQLDTLLRH
ncbi:MAG: glutaredoxin domain-containing protein [Candidatus Thiodiazotropha sp.]